MRPKISKLVKGLQLGNYMIHVDESGRASALPITSASVSFFKKNIQYRCSDSHRPVDLKSQGNFILSKDAEGYITEMLPMTAEESKVFILGVLGA